MEAAKLGKHVLTDKPLDITRENMDMIMSACEEAGVQLGVCFQRRMSPDNQTLKKLVEGELPWPVLRASDSLSS